MNRVVDIVVMMMELCQGLEILKRNNIEEMDALREENVRLEQETKR